MIRWLIMILFLSSCASADFIYGPGGKVVHVEMKGNVSAKAKNVDGTEVEVDGKFTDIFKGLFNVNKL